MSGIAGIFQLDGAAVMAATIEKMAAALAHLGADGNSVICAGSVAFAHLMLWTTPESLHESAPLSDPPSALLLTADARIDNRQELADALGLTYSLRNLSDSQLILAAYQKWGEACVDHLQGVYVFAIWDEPRRTLVCVTDPFNLRPLYYYHDAHRFIFASEINGILAAPMVPKRLDERKLALSALSPLDLREKERTFIAGVRMALGASVLSVTVEGVRIRRYWQPDPNVRLAYRSDQEWLEAFRAEFTNAIDACTRSAFPVAAMVSGGLDSSAIVSLAARRLAERNCSLMTVTAVKEEDAPASVQDERAYAELLRDLPNLEMHFVSAPGRGPLDSIQELVLQHMTPHIDTRHFLTSAAVERVREHNGRILLFGVGGEYGPSTYAVEYLAELFCKGRWWTLAREMKLLSQVESYSLSYLAVHALMQPFVPPRIRAFKKSQMPPWLAMQPLRQEYVASILGAELLPPKQKGSPFPTLPDHRRHLTQAMETVSNYDSLDTFLGYSHIRQWFPFIQKRFVEFCLAAPGHLKFHNGYRRHLLRSGVDGMLPPALQWRVTKAPFATDYGFRFNRQRRKLQELLASIQPSDPLFAVLDMPRLQRLAAQDANEARRDWESGYATLSTLPRTVGLIHFLRLF